MEEPKLESTGRAEQTGLNLEKEDVTQKELLNYIEANVPTDPNAAIMLSMINADECLNCYPFVFQKQDFFKKHFNLPPQNMMMLFPDCRDVEARALMDDLLVDLKDSTRTVLDDTLDNLVESYTEKRYRTSYYLLFNEHDVLMEMGSFTEGADEGVLEDEGRMDSLFEIGLRRGRHESEENVKKE